MNSVNINNRWYIVIHKDENGFNLMINPNNEFEPISFENNQKANDFINNQNIK